MDKSRISAEYISRYEALPWDQQLRLLASLKAGRPVKVLTSEAVALYRDIRKE